MLVGGGELYICKSSDQVDYLNRLVRQAEKQRRAASSLDLHHIRIPEIYGIETDENVVKVYMQYIYSKNFVEFFEHAGFEQVNFLIETIINFIEYEIRNSPIKVISRHIVNGKFKDVRNKILSNPLLSDNETTMLSKAERIFESLPDISLPVGMCHGDLTFSNILFTGNNYYLIDFLDSFIESPLIDIIKIRQDTSWLWSPLMYTRPYDRIRLKIAFEKIDMAVDAHFSNRYEWYRNYYKEFQLLNFLRILQYAHEPHVIKYLQDTLNEQLSTK